MRRGAVVLCVAALACVLLASGAGASRVHADTSVDALGKRQVERFLNLLHKPDVSGLRAFLSPAFVLQRANGTSATKTEYLAAPAIVESYEIQDLTAARADNVLVARYNVVVDSTINGQQQSTDPAPRLSVFVKGPKGWQIVAHANFNSLVGEPPATTTTTG